MFLCLYVCASNQSGLFWDSPPSTILQYIPTHSGLKHLQHFFSTLVDW